MPEPTHEVLMPGVGVLRAWRPGDEPSLVRHANNRKVWANLRDFFPSPYTPEAAAQWVAFASSQSPQVDFAIEVGGEAVGGIGLRLLSDIERCSAEVGYWLGESLWGRGITTAALLALSRDAFVRLPVLTRIFALPFAENVGSRRVLEKAGFVCEGILRRSAVKEGRGRDQAMYALIREG